MSSRALVAALLGLAALLADAAPAAPLTIAVSRSPLSLPLYVAEAEGYFADAGLSARLMDCVGGHRCLKLLLDGAAGAATAADSPIVFRSFERDDFVVVGTFATSSGDAKLVARSDAGIAQPAQLAGKRVGIVRGASSQFFLDSYLLLHGVDPRALRLVDLQPEEMAGALAKGRVDAVSTWEPHGFDSVQALAGRATLLPHTGVYEVTFNLVVPRRSARDDELKRLLRAVDRAETLIRTDPARAQAILRARLNVDQRFVDWVWPGVDYRLGLEPGLVKTLESEARWALREGHVRAKAVPDYLRYVDALPLGAVNPTAVGLAR